MIRLDICVFIDLAEVTEAILKGYRINPGVEMIEKKASTEGLMMIYTIQGDLKTIMNFQNMLGLQKICSSCIDYEIINQTR